MSRSGIWTRRAPYVRLRRCHVFRAFCANSPFARQRQGRLRPLSPTVRLFDCLSTRAPGREAVTAATVYDCSRRPVECRAAGAASGIAGKTQAGSGEEDPGIAGSGSWEAETARPLEMLRYVIRAHCGGRGKYCTEVRRAEAYVCQVGATNSYELKLGDPCAPRSSIQWVH
ncbi:hypothetical protein C8Q70DRAFT_527015 [Cubamyces menziesii]|nr:hypothetical protein C8Q70DRAFT_527015 [Cubamyces menziesii]